MSFQQEMISMRVWLENNAKTSTSIVDMQNDLELVLGYAERVGSMIAEVKERIVNQKKDEYDRLIGRDDLTDLGKKVLLDARVAADERLAAELTTLGRRLKDTKWLLMQACSILKTELLKLH